MNTATMREASCELGNAIGTYLGSSYDYKTDKFDWSLNENKLINMTANGFMGGLSADVQYQVAQGMQLQSNYLTNFTWPSFNFEFIPGTFLPCIPSVTLPSYFPGMPPSPLPLPQTTPLNSY